MTPEELSAVLKPLIDAIKHASDKGPYDWFIGGLTTLSLLLVAWSTVLTRKMQKAADQQATASLASMREAELQRQHSEELLRAAKTPVVVLSVDDDQIMFVNVGQAPAINMVPVTSTEELPHSWVLSIPDALAGGSSSKFKMFTRDGSIVVSTQTELVAALRRKLLPYPVMTLKVIYEDVGGGRYESYFKIEHADGDDWAFRFDRFAMLERATTRESK